MLNLGNLKHVKEYTVQKTTVITSDQLKEEQKKKDSRQQQRQPQNNFDNRNNQWYHYSTKLEVNIKLLSGQVDQLEKTLHETREQVKKEKIEREHEVEFNRELKKVIKQLRQKIKNDQEINQFQTFD